MKIRIMGTIPELEVAQRYYKSLGNEDYVAGVEISRVYLNRGSTCVGRVYVDITYSNLENAKSSLPAVKK